MGGRSGVEHVDKRHFFLCNGETRSWEQSWYTEPFFISQRASFDRAASDGPVQPPASIVETVQGCTALQSEDALTAGGSGGQLTPVGVATRTMSRMVPMTTTGSNGIMTTSSPFTYTTTMLSGFARPSITVSTSSSSAGSSGLSQASRDPSAISSCAGDWDWQAWGAVASLGFGLIVGGVMWLLWVILKKRIPALYSPRQWFVEERPSTANTVKSFFLPFFNLPSLKPPADQPLTEAQMSLHVQLAVLKLAAIPTVLGLGVALPLMIANVPCLSQTTPVNERGGRLGSLNDLSLLRLLNALDPSPDSAAGDQSISNALKLPKRALSSTIAPALSSARVRLIFLLVVIGLVSLLSAFFVIFRSYTAFASYQTRFDNDVCGGRQMVYVNGRGVFEGKNEEGVRKILRKFGIMKRVGVHAEALERERKEDREIEVVGVFAIADTSRLRPLINERAEVLNKLEEAETRYIHSFTTSTSSLTEQIQLGESPRAYKRRTRQGPNNAMGDPTGSAPSGYVAPISFYKLKDLPDLPSSRIQTPVPGDRDMESSQSTMHEEPGFAENVGARVVGSRFVEVNRDSVFHGGKLPIGQRVKITEDGVMVPDDSPPLDGAASQYPEDAPGDHEGERSPLAGEQRIKRSLGLPNAELSRSTSPAQEPSAHDALLPADRPKSTRHKSTDSYVMVPMAITGRNQLLRPHSSISPATLSEFYNAIGGHRARLKELNEELTQTQGEIYELMAEGKSIIGWIFVGRGVKHLPFAQEIEGRTREDIDWVGIQTGRNRHNHSFFWLRVMLIMLGLAILLVPFVGLAVGSAPGFAGRLGFLESLAASDGFGAGVAESVAPAIAIALLTAVAVALVHACARHVESPSIEHKNRLAFQALLAILFTVLVVWLIALAAVLYGVDALAKTTQTTRHVGDGSVYIAWFLFCLLLNFAIIIPALILLQPLRLISYWRAKLRVRTPRQRFRLFYPSTFVYTVAMCASTLSLLYGLVFIAMFPLLALPVLLLIILTFAAMRYMTTQVWCEVSGGPSSVRLAMGTIRVLAWGLGLQPALYGLLLLSRREWAIGGAAIGFAVVIVGICEAFMASKRPRRTKPRQSTETLRGLSSVMKQPLASGNSLTALPTSPGSGGTTTSRSRRVSNVSTILQMIHSLLPSVSRLPTGPLPLSSEHIDDLVSTEKAARHMPDTDTPHHLPALAFADPAKETDGLLYPPELLAPVPVIWLPDDKAGVGRLEAADLARYHHLSATVGATDPNW